MSYTYTIPQIYTDKNKIQAGVINLMVELDIMEGSYPLDISSASVVNIIIQKPDESVITHPASLRTDGRDGKIYHLTVLGDMDIEGDYYIQAYVEMPPYKTYTTPVKLAIYENIPVTATET